MKRVKEIYQKIIEVTEEIGANHVGAYAAQSAYFFYAVYDSDHFAFADSGTVYPCHQGGCDDCGNAGFPHLCGFHDATIVNQVYNQSTGIIPITIIVALWSAARVFLP